MAIRSALRGFLVLLVVGLVGGCDAGVPDNAVARVDDATLTVDQAVSLMQTSPNIPRNEEAVRLVTDLWIDYTLLARFSQEDSTFGSFDVSPLVDAQLDQDLLLAYRDSMVQPDTVFTEAELREAYQMDDSGVQLRARHILLSFPDDATEAQRDSVESLARELRDRIAQGEDFAALAREYSDDPGSGAQGGDLGTFGRGRMVPSFDEAAFALEEGEVSEPVESPYGLHIIQVQERITQDFAANRDQFEQQHRARTVFRAESTFIAGLEEEAGLSLEEGAVETARSLAGDPSELPQGAGRSDFLVSYDGGGLTVGEYMDFIRTRPAQERAQIEQATDAQVEGAVMNLSRRDLLLQRAEEAGMELAEARGDTLRDRVRANLAQAASQLRPSQETLDSADSEQAAIQTAVMDVLTRTLEGNRAPVQLGGLSYVLRDPVEVEISDEGVQQVLEGLQSGASSPGSSGPAGAPGAAPQGSGGAEAPGGGG